MNPELPIARMNSLVGPAKLECASGKLDAKKHSLREISRDISGGPGISNGSAQDSLRYSLDTGVQLLPVAGIMFLLFLSLAIVYALGGISLIRAVYYSVVTFTTSPPEPPSQVGLGMIGMVVATVGNICGHSCICVPGICIRNT